MKILALDTATRSCSVALMDDEQVIAEYTVAHGDTHSRYVMGMFHEILRAVRWAMDDLDGFAVTTGPGSFTGLRIGLSTIKGLALAVDRPVVGISSLEALAYPFSVTGKLICPMLDARRQEVYAAFYRYTDLRLEFVSPPVAVRPTKALDGIHEPCIFAGDGALAYRDQIMGNLGPLAIFANQHMVRASAVGHLAIARFRANQTNDPGDLEPLYLRSSDAEKNLKVPASGKA